MNNYKGCQVVFKIQEGRSVKDIPMHTASVLCSITNKVRPTQVFNFIFETFAKPRSPKLSCR